MKIKNFVTRKRSITRNSKHLRRKLYVHNGKHRNCNVAYKKGLLQKSGSFL